MLRLKDKTYFLLSFAVFLSGHHALAFGLKNTQLTVRMGVVNGSYTSPLQEGAASGEGGGGNVSSNLEGGGFMVPTSLDLDYEIFKNQRQSYFVRSIIALNMSTGKMNYQYLGLGLRNYFKGVGLPRIFMSEHDLIKTIPKTRMYYGYDFGFSRVSVVDFGTVLSAVSTGIDFGGHVGYTKQMGDTWGLNAQAGLSYAYGISTVAAAGMNMKMLFGMTYSL